MLIESSRIFLKKAVIWLNDRELKNAIDSGKYSAITALSYNKLSLPGFRVKPKKTTVIPLTPSEDEIFKKFSDTTRNEIGRTHRTDGFDFVSDDKNFKAIHSLYKDFEYLHGMVPFSWNALKECAVFSAYYMGEPVSGIFVDQSAPYLRVRCIFSKRLETEDKEFYNKIAWASKRLVWEICRWGKKGGFISLDLAVVSFINPKIEGIRKFKMSFGGDVIDEYTYIYKSFWYKIFEKFAYFKIIALRFLFLIKTTVYGK